MHVRKRIRRALLRRLLPQPVGARHAEYSMLFSADDSLSPVSPRLLSLALEAIHHAQQISLEPIAARMPHPPYYPEVWPGEIYKLLAGIVRVLKPSSVIEIGTGGGTSTLAILQVLPASSQLVTFDILGWRDWPGCLLREEDFRDGRLVQHTDDLSDPAQFETHRRAIEGADFIYVDAAKDGVMESRLLQTLETVGFATPPILMFDDIRLWNMLKIWRDLSHPKLDLTSFGHWTGTGLVQWAST